MTLHSPDVKIDLYDDGVIDGDSVTVFINNKLLLYHRMLTDRPLTIHFNAFPNTEYELVMYADNLGTIPPNTALLMVTSGSEKYEAFMSSSEQTKRDDPIYLQALIPSAPGYARLFLRNPVNR